MIVKIIKKLILPADSSWAWTKRKCNTEQKNGKSILYSVVWRLVSEFRLQI